jgi:ABC-2 type transport system permease protein
MQLLVGRGLEDVAIHLFSGFVLVHYFTETFGAGTASIVRNRTLVQKLPMPREMFPVASMLVSAYHTIPQFVILVIASAVAGWTPDLVGVAAGLLGFAIIALFGTAMALLFSAANVYFRDFQRIVGTVTTVVHFGVPMIYPYSLVAERFGQQFVGPYLANPLAESVLLMQRCLWVGATSNPRQTIAIHLPDDLFTRGLIELAACGLLLVFAQIAFSKLETKFPERL